MGYRVSTEMRGGRSVYRLHDDDSGASAAVLPSFGFNLFDLRLPVSGHARRVVVAADDFADNPRSPGRNGIPVLFPFPNRVRDGKYTFEGKSYQLPATNGSNAIHGFAIQAAWDVVEHVANAEGASLTGRYQISKQSPDMRPLWPADAVLQMRYRLAGRRLELTVTVSNPSTEGLPYGFGIHPYFQLPLLPGGSLEKTAVVLPASQYWVLQDFLPTGERKPVDSRIDFRAGRPLAGLKLDDVLTGLEYHGDLCVCRMVDHSAGAELRLSFDRGFRELVAYTPPGSPGVISLEPYTQTTDAINLQAKGVDAGLRVLRPGAQDRFTIALETIG
jgi:aldose 1-epimerase